MNMGDLLARIKAYLLSNSPSAMSVGARVCVPGSIFIWFPGFSPGLVALNGLVNALNEHNYMPYISARVVLDAMRNPDQAFRKVGFEVCHSELRLCDCILVGDPAFTKSGQHATAAMPGPDGSSSSTRGEHGPEMETKAPLGLQLNGDVEQPNEEQQPTTAGESGPDDQAAETDTEWEAEENETVPVRRVLRDEANSVAHYSLHRPGLPQHCEECRHAKTKRKKRFCKTFGEKVPNAASGDTVTCDHVNFRDVCKNKWVNGYAEGLTYLDRHTNFRMAQLTPVTMMIHSKYCNF